MIPTWKSKKLKCVTDFALVKRNLDIKKFSFPQRCREVWNGLDKRAIEARIIRKFQEVLNFHRYGNRKA